MFTALRFCHRRPTGFNVTSGPTFIGTAETTASKLDAKILR